MRRQRQRLSPLCLLLAVLLSGATILKQDMGVREWFEPLLRPWIHFIPVSSALTNLTEAVGWARSNSGPARRLAGSVRHAVAPAAPAPAATVAAAIPPARLLLLIFDSPH